MRDILRLTIAAIATAAGAPTDLASVAPHLARLVERAEREPAVVAEELAAFSTATIMQPLVPLMGLYRDQPARKVSNVSLPVVVAHGMGDSCFNAGMKSVTTAAGDHLGVYSTCIPTGDGRLRDTIDGFLMNMDKSVDVFAQKVKADPKLAGGFNAFGLSQGNNLIRGCAPRPLAAACTPLPLGAAAIASDLSALCDLPWCLAGTFRSTTTRLSTRSCRSAASTPAWPHSPSARRRCPSSAACAPRSLRRSATSRTSRSSRLE